jgi:nucleotide-binding universal stress UspA family protein
MKILFALDGSPRALAALDVLLARLDWFAKPVSLDLVHVHPELPYPGAVSRIGKDNVQQYYDDESNQVLEPALARAKAKNVNANAVHLVGDAASEIVRQAATGYDLIVMSARGHTALANLVIGSVTTKVIASSKVPVLLLR